MRYVLVLTLLVAAGCRLDMHDQPRHEPYELRELLEMTDAARQPPEGTVARGDLVATSTVVPRTAALLQRGRERYDIYCSPCHDYVGTGNGLVVQRGFPPPPSLHTDRLRKIDDAYLYGVITKGYGKMYDYKASVRPSDRWAIVAYIRALQRSQNARIDDVPAAEREALTGGGS